MSTQLNAFEVPVHAQLGGFLRLPGLPNLTIVQLTIVKAASHEAPVLTVADDSFACQVLIALPEGGVQHQSHMVGFRTQQQRWRRGSG